RAVGHVGNGAVRSSTPASTPTDERRARLAAAFPNERPGLVADMVREQVMAIMRLDAAHAPGRRDRLMALGMDSLMAVQLRDRLSAALGLGTPPPATLIYDHPTIDDLTQLLLPLVVPEDPSSSPVAQPVAD